MPSLLMMLFFILGAVLPIRASILRTGGDAEQFQLQVKNVLFERGSNLVADVQCVASFPQALIQKLTNLDNASTMTALRPTADAKQDLIVSVLDGSQLCQGDWTDDAHKDRVAMMLTGYSFRAKNFGPCCALPVCKVQCTTGTAQAQKMLIASHMTQIVLPLEKMGFVVDVFLTHLGCDDQAIEEHGASDLPPITRELTSDDALDLLKAGYGRQRVAGVMRGNMTRNQQQHKHDMLRFVADHARANAKTYAYFVQLRYDLMIHTATDLFDRMSPRKSMLQNASLAARNGLTFLTSIEDFMFAYPGGLANCIDHLLQDCIGWDPSKQAIPLDARGCYRMGSIDLEPFSEDQYRAFASMASVFRSYQDDSITLTTGPYSASSVFIPRLGNVASMSSCDVQRILPDDAGDATSNDILLSQVPNQIIPYFHYFTPY